MTANKEVKEWRKVQKMILRWVEKTDSSVVIMFKPKATKRDPYPQIKYAGSPRMKSFIKNETVLQEFGRCADHMLTRTTTRTIKEDMPILTPDFALLNMDNKRSLITSLVKNYVLKEWGVQRDFWGIAGCMPPFWPEGIPFRSPNTSKSHIGPGLKAQDLTEILKEYIHWRASSNTDKGDDMEEDEEERREVHCQEQDSKLILLARLFKEVLEQGEDDMEEDEEKRREEHCQEQHNITVGTSQAVCKVNAYTLTQDSFEFLKTTLSDELMNAYLSTLIKGENVYQIDSLIATAIFTGQTNIHAHLRNVDFNSYDYCLCAVNEGGSHWVLVVIIPNEKTILYLNPLGESIRKCQVVLQYWYDFLTGRTFENIDDAVQGWKIKTVDHSKQTDGISCGVYVLKFAENILTGRSLNFSWSPEEIENERDRIASILLDAGKKDVKGDKKERSEEV